MKSELARGEHKSLQTDRMAASPLMDHAGFTRELESAYRDAWRRWCASAQVGDTG